MWRHVEWAGSLHFRLHTSDLAPVGRLLVAAGNWGLDERQVMTTLTGASPATSAPTRALSAIADEPTRVGAEPPNIDILPGRMPEMMRSVLILDPVAGTVTVV